eukprot:4687060-Amphidinium_carterae.2
MLREQPSANSQEERVCASFVNRYSNYLWKVSDSLVHQEHHNGQSVSASGASVRDVMQAC